MAVSKDSKQIRVLFSPYFDTEYAALVEQIKKEKAEKIVNSQNMQLLKAIDRVINVLKVDPDYGIHISKNLMPKQLIQDYQINNLWKINLPNGWRLLYTLSTNRLEIIALLLDFLDHKKYDKLFGYKKK